MSGRPVRPVPHSEVAERLALRLSALETDELRARAAALALQQHSPSEVVLIIASLFRRARESRVAATALAVFSRALGRGLVDVEFTAACLEAAHSRAERAVEAMFAAGPAARNYDFNDETFVDKRMRSMPLGQRRALTRGRDIDQLSRLAHDLDPVVITQLLANPRVTEREAVLVASRRPTRGEILECVLASRFGPIQRVCAALAHNPYAPLALAVRAMTGLTLSHLRAIAGDEKLSDEVRRHARTLIVVRRPTPAERDAHPPPAAADDATTREALDTLLASLSPDLDDTQLEVISD